jgi:hypothetical protein
MNEQEPESGTPSDAAVLAFLTINGEIPLEDIGLVGWTIYAYNRGMGCYLAMIIEDNRMAEECRKFLHRIGREFKTVRELPRW